MSKNPPEFFRLDDRIAALGLAPSRDHAQGLIAAGRVAVDGRPASHATTEISPRQKIEILPPREKFVSRAGVKLSAALRAFRVDPRGKICLDLGASTGGFSEVLLRRGAAKIIAVERGSGQLAPALRGRPGLISREKTDALGLAAGDFEKAPELVVADLSFAPIEKFLPKIREILAPGGDAVILVKPQFQTRETARGRVRDDAGAEILAGVESAARAAGFRVRGRIESPIRGRARGNREFLLWLRPEKSLATRGILR